jgi:two-component system NtrC family sensor kinase
LAAAKLIQSNTCKRISCRYIGSDYENLDDYKQAFNYLTEGNGYFTGKDTSIDHILILNYIGAYYENLSDYKNAFDFYLKAKKLADAASNSHSVAVCNNYLGRIYTDMREYKTAVSYQLKALKYYETSDRKVTILTILTSLGSDYNAINDYENALFYDKKALSVADQLQGNDYKAVILNNMSNVYYNKKNFGMAYTLVSESAKTVRGENNKLYSLCTMGEILKDAPDSSLKKFGIKPGEKYLKAINCFKASNLLADKYHVTKIQEENYKQLGELYEKIKNYPSAYQAYKQFIVYKDSVYSDTKKSDFVKKELQYQYQKQEDSLKYQQAITSTKLRAKQTQTYYFMAGLGCLMLLSVFIWLNYDNQRKSNKLITVANYELSEQREEITAQRDQLSETISKLKSAQNHLIQSAKMASLGELTAGIAHEIQNPLNFVNNFSEVNKEMLEELKAESIKPKPERNEQLEIDLINDLIENESKINHHGKRADFIVKGMLEHSRTGTGEKQLTDLNVLCDEFMKLSYHGLRAKDKNFNAELVAHFDDGLPKVNVSQQDIGRVLVNLFNNAFYAVSQKLKTVGAEYKPEVSATTASENGNVIIKVKDNGNGIPDAIKDKIMQPFFTTKPTGEGTGLGLSLSYDIVVKGHGGNITVDTREDEFTEFTVILPIS